MAENYIKYIFVGNVKTIKKIVDYPEKVKKEISDDAENIFKKLAESKNYQYDQDFKIESQNGVLHFKISPTNTFYLLLADKYMDRNKAFEILNDIQKKNIYLMVNEKGEISTQGKQLFVETITKTKKSSDGIKMAQIKVNEVHEEVKLAVGKAVVGVADLEDLEGKAKKIEEAAKEMEEGARKLSWCAWLQKVKWIIIITVLVIVALIIIIVPIVVSVNNKEEAAKNGGVNNTTIINLPSNKTLLYF